MRVVSDLLLQLNRVWAARERRRLQRVRTELGDQITSSAPQRGGARAEREVNASSRGSGLPRKNIRTSTVISKLSEVEPIFRQVFSDP